MFAAMVGWLLYCIVLHGFYCKYINWHTFKIDTLMKIHEQYNIHHKYCQCVAVWKMNFHFWILATTHLRAVIVNAGNVHWKYWFFTLWSSILAIFENKLCKYWLMPINTCWHIGCLFMMSSQVNMHFQQASQCPLALWADFIFQQATTYWALRVHNGRPCTRGPLWSHIDAAQGVLV